MLLRIKRFYLPSLVKVMLIIPFCLLAVLAVYARFFGQNVFAALIFWFAILPVLTIYLNKIFSGEKGLMRRSVYGLIIFYGIIVVMIYKHYQSDYFVVMMASFVYNLFIMMVVSVVKKMEQRQGTT